MPKSDAKEKLINDVVGHLLTGPLLKEDVGKTAEDIVDGIVAECAHVAQSLYIDCAPEEEQLVGMVQQLVYEAIYKRFS